MGDAACVVLVNVREWMVKREREVPGWWIVSGEVRDLLDEWRREFVNYSHLFS